MTLLFFKKVKKKPNRMRKQKKNYFVQFAIGEWICAFAFFGPVVEKQQPKKKGRRLLVRDLNPGRLIKNQES